MAAIVGLEGYALKLGTSVATHAAKFWLQRRRTQFERGASLAELAQAELKSPLQKRKLENLVDRIGQQIAEQLAPVLEHRYGDLPNHEAEAAILAVVDVLADVDLSDKALLSADADAEVLAKRIRGQFPKRTALLTPRAEELHELALDQACRHLVQVVRYLPSFQPAALAEALSRMTAQSEQLDLLLSRVPSTSLYAPRGVDRDQEFRAEYAEKLAANLDRLELLGLPGNEQPTLALTVAYLSLRVSPSSPQRIGKRRNRPGRWVDLRNQKQLQAAEGVPVESAIGDESRVLLRGDAGSGKTTLLNWLAVRAARSELSGPLSEWNACVPFIIRLRTFAEGDLPAPEKFVVHCTPMIAEIMPDGWTHRLFKAGRAMLLVDGVDEVPVSRRRGVKTWLRDLLTVFPRIRVVVTARTAATDRHWLKNEEFHTVTLEPMAPGNILDFVERWHHAAELSGADVTNAEHRLRGQLERSHLRQLAASPLLCAMLCALNLAHRSELPRNRMDLYAKALAMLLHLRDAERGIIGLLGDAEKRVLLRDLAWRLTLANKVELPTSVALDHITRKLPGMPNTQINPESILDHLLERSGVLREPALGRVDFVHRTFLEYLAADEAVQQHHIDTLIAHAHQDTWWETIVMACGHATTMQVSELLTGILNRAEEEMASARHLRLLAAACLETIDDIDAGVRARIDAVVREKLVPPRGMSETRSLTAIGNRILNYLPATLEDLSDAKAAATTRAAALAGTIDALPVLASYAQDPRSIVHRELESAWNYFDPERFAEVVLANSPLKNGSLAVRSRKHLPYVRYIRALTSLSVQLPPHESQSGLHIITGLPSLKNLEVYLDSEKSHDLSVLREHQGLETLHLEGLDSTEDLSPLMELKGLRYVMFSGYRDEALSGVVELNSVERLILFSEHESSLEHASRVFRSAKYVNLSDFHPLDLTEVVNMTLIEDLMLQHLKFETIAPLARLTELKSLSIANNVIFDYDLRSLAKFNTLSLNLAIDVEYIGVDEAKSRIQFGM